MSRLHPGLKLALYGGFLAALLTLLVGLLLRKSPGEASSLALQLGGCASLGTAFVAPAFLRLGPAQVARALLLASAALAMTYVLFGLVNVVQEFLVGSEAPFSVLLALPVFAMFSLPLALPVALVSAWYLHRRNTHLVHP
jgi:hypothetical protein